VEIALSLTGDPWAITASGSVLYRGQHEICGHARRPTGQPPARRGRSGAV
jgi:hypothetical protein